MPKIRPLTSAEAKRSLAHRLGVKVGDKVRQLATKFGIRPHRCFMVWGKWTGDARGEGTFEEVTRTELLPTPRVSSLDSVALDPRMAGVLPMGTIRVDQVSVSYTEDQLTGLKFAGGKHIKEPFDFFYEIVEDGRGDDPPPRARFRLSGKPFRRAGQVDWSILLERQSEDLDRDGVLRYEGDK